MRETVKTGSSRPSDDELLVALRGTGPRREEAVSELHALLLGAARFEIRKRAAALRHVRSDEIEDLATQAADDACVAVIGKVHRFRGESRFTTWAYKFGVLHAGVVVRRQAWRHRAVPLPDTLTLVDTAPTPAAVSEAIQLARAVEAAIATELTPHQRRVVLALLVEQVPIDVLADRLGSTRNALYKTLHDARRRLRTALTDSGHLQIRPDRSTP